MVFQKINIKQNANTKTKHKHTLKATGDRSSREENDKPQRENKNKIRKYKPTLKVSGGLQEKTQKAKS